MIIKQSKLAQQYGKYHYIKANLLINQWLASKSHVLLKIEKIKFFIMAFKKGFHGT
jgi:hypothetical protein